MLKKIPLVLIPGLLCDGVLWKDQAAALSRIAICTITDKHMHHDTIGGIAEAIVAEAPSRFALAGLSMGGYIALEICRRFGERVDRLALIDTSARADTHMQKDRRESLITRCREGKFENVAETLYPFLVHASRLADSTLRREVIDMAGRIGPENFIRQQRAIMDRIDQVPNLSTIDCPTVVVCGEHDQITPLECSEEMAANISEAELVTVSNCGHMSTMEKPERVSRIMHQWLTQKRSSRN
ncbi:MAG: alpha/beta hydrolase [Deltaproteobacteria bacterium]|nr:alpha/beta hydrolase [Deltaproteobacteria bacterium]